MARITVKHRHGQSFDIQVRGYPLVSDEPITLGGDDEGPTPTELMVAGLAACGADEVVKCLVAIGARFEPTEVGTDFAWVAGARPSGSPSRSPRGSARTQGRKCCCRLLSCPARKMLAEPPNVEYTVIRQASSPLQFSRPQ